MLLSFHVGCLFLSVLIFYSRLLVDTASVFTSSYSSAHNVNVSRDLLLAGTIRGTSSVRIVASISANGTTNVGNSSAIERVSTTRMVGVHSSGIVTAPISSVVNKNDSSGQLSQTAVSDHEPSSHKHQSKETLSTSLTSNSTAIFLPPNATSVLTNTNSTKTFAYIRSATHISPSPSVVSIVPHQSNETNIHNTTISPKSSRANLLGYGSSISFNNSNWTVVLSSITASQLTGASKIWPSSKNRSEYNPGHSSTLLLTNSTRGLSKVVATTTSVSKKLNNSSNTIVVPSSTWKVNEMTSITSSGLDISNTLENTNEVTQTRSDASRLGNITATISGLLASSTYGSHGDHYNLSTSYTSRIMAQSSLLLNISSRTRSEFDSKLRLSTSIPASSVNNYEWNVSSVKHIPNVYFTSSSRHNTFRNSTTMTGSTVASVLPYSTLNNFSTSALPTSALLTEGFIKNTTSPSLPKGNHTSVLRLLKSTGSTTVNISSASQAYSTSVDTQPSTSIAEKRQTVATKSKDQSLPPSLSGSIFAINSPSFVGTVVSSGLKYSSTSIIINSNKTTAWSNILLGTKSLLSMNAQVEPSHSTVSGYIGSSFRNIKVVINSTKPTGGSSIEATSDLITNSSKDLSNKSLFIVRPTSNSLPVSASTSNVNGVSVVPSYTPCYISYMVTLSRRVTQPFFASTINIENGTSEKLKLASFADQSSNQPLESSTPVQPTLTKLPSRFSSTKMLSKSPTQSLSSLPDHIASSVQSKHDATMTKRITNSAMINKPNYSQSRNFTNTRSSMFKGAKSSFDSRELTVSHNFTTRIQNDTKVSIYNSSSISLISTPARISSVKVTSTINISPSSNISRSVNKLVNAGVYNGTTTVLMNSTSFVSSTLISGLSHSRSKMVYQSMVKNTTTIGQKITSVGKNVSAEINQSSIIISASPPKEISILETATKHLFATNITSHTKHPGSMQPEIPMTTAFVKQEHQTVSWTINSTAVQSASFHESSSFNVSRQSETSSWKVQPTHVFSNRTNQTTTGYFDSRDASVRLSVSGPPVKTTNVQMHGTAMSTLASLTSPRTEAQNNGTKNQTVLQPTPALSRTPSLSNLSALLTLLSPMLTSSEPLSNLSYNKKSTSFEESFVVNSTQMPGSLLTQHNMPTTPTTRSANLSSRGILGRSSNSECNKTMLITPSKPVVIRHIPNTSGIGVSRIVSETVPKENIQSASIKVTSATPIIPIVVLPTKSNSQWASPQTNYTLLFSLNKTISSFATFRATPSSSTSSTVKTNPLRRKKREVKQINATRDQIESNFMTSVLKNFTMTPTLNKSLAVVSTSTWRTAERIEVISTERLLSVSTESLHHTFKSVLKHNATNATHNPLLVTTSSTENPRITFGSNLLSSRSAKESTLPTKVYNSSDVPTLTSISRHSGAFMISPNYTSSTITRTVRDSSILKSRLLPNFSSRTVTSTMNSTNKARPLVTASAPQLGSYQRINTKQYNASVANAMDVDITTLLANRSTLVSTITEKLEVMITATTSTHHFAVITASFNEENISSKPKMTPVWASTSTFLNSDIIKNSSSVNTSYMLTTKSANRPNSTLTMREEINETIVHTSKSILVQNVSYTSSFRFTSSSSQLLHQSKIRYSESSLNKEIVPSRALTSTLTMFHTPRLVNFSSHSIDHSGANKTMLNSTVQTESVVTAVKPTNSVIGVTPTSVINRNSQAVSENTRVASSLTSQRPMVETTNINQSLALIPSHMTKSRTYVVSQRLSIVVSSISERIATATLELNLSFNINVSSAHTSALGSSPLVNSTLATKGLFLRSSKNIPSFIAPTSTYLLSTSSSFIHENISGTLSTTVTPNIHMTPSPSPSFSIIGSRVITATPSLHDESYVSSKAVVTQSDLSTTADRDHFTANSSATLTGKSSVILSRVLERNSQSHATTVSKKQAGGYFSYTVIPTSSLGWCLVSYSTVLANNSVTLSTQLVNVTASLETPVSSSAKINSTRIFTSSVSIHFNASSKELLYSSQNRTEVVLTPSVERSFVVEKSSVSFSSQGESRSSWITRNVSTVNITLIKSSLSESATMIFSKISSSITSRAQILAIPTAVTATHASETYTVINFSPSTSLTSATAYQISPSVSDMVKSSSVATTHAPTSFVDENTILIIVLSVDVNTDVSTDTFKKDLENKLNIIYQDGRLIERRRRRRSTASYSRVEIENIQRKDEDREVDVKFIVIANNRTLSAQKAAKTMNGLSKSKMGEIIKYDVLSTPKPVLIVQGVLAMLIKTTSEKNLSNPAVRSSFEMELASFYQTSKSLPSTVKATIVQVFHEPLGNTYIEFMISVDNVTISRSIVKETFDVDANVLTMQLEQTVSVVPYIPGELKPRNLDYIVQNMQFDNISKLDDIKDEIGKKLTEVYVRAQLKGSRKRKRRALGSIEAVITGTSWTQGYSADVTYYITDAGKILNATYACSVLNRLTLSEMSRTTSPYSVNSTPRPQTPTTAGTSDSDGEYPSWFIPVIIAACVGFGLLVLVIILYCRWKKGAPPKKIQPHADPPTEVQKPRMTHAAEPEAKPALRRPPPPRTAVVVEENGQSEARPRPAPRKHLVKEGSLRRKVPSRESISTRTNPAFEAETVDGSDISDPPNRRPETNVVVGRRTQLELPRRTVPPSSKVEYLPSDEEDESEESEEESVFTENTNQHSAGTLPPVAVMSDPGTHETTPPVIFRKTVHPEPSLPPLDLKHTSLVGRVVEEEGSIQKEMKTKADIERWRNKQRQREKRLGESQRKSGNKRPSFTEKKAWGRAQQEIGSVLDPEAMQPIVRKPRRKPRRKYKIKAETTDEEENVELRGFKKLTSPRNERVDKVQQESQSDSDISMGEARRRMIALIDDAFTSIKSVSKKHPEATDKVDAGAKPQKYHKDPPPLHPRPQTLAPALPEPPPSHGRASVPSARHRRRFMNSQNSFPYPSQYYPGMSGSYSPRYPPPPPPPVVTKNPLVVWDPADKQRTLNQSAYRPYGAHPYSYTDGQLHFTPVQQTPDGMGGLIWSPYATEYAMEDFYRNVEIPGTLDPKNSSFLSKMQETPLSAASEASGVPRDAVIDMPERSESGTAKGESAEPLVRAIKDELFRLASGRTPVKHL